eukprot:9394360-Pyramimonas_sp.AAC.1
MKGIPIERINAPKSATDGFPNSSANSKVLPVFGYVIFPFALPLDRAASSLSKLRTSSGARLFTFFLTLLGIENCLVVDEHDACGKLTHASLRYSLRCEISLSARNTLTGNGCREGWSR